MSIPVMLWVLEEVRDWYCTRSDIIAVVMSLPLEAVVLWWVGTLWLESVWLESAEEEEANTDEKKPPEEDGTGPYVI